MRKAFLGEAPASPCLSSPRVNRMFLVAPASRTAEGFWSSLAALEDETPGPLGRKAVTGVPPGTTTRDWKCVFIHLFVCIHFVSVHLCTHVCALLEAT